MTPDDNELILQAQQGSTLAFEQLVQRHDRKVLSIAVSYSRNAEDAKDIYQEVFLRVFRALPKFQFRSRFSTWLHRIATNVCLTHRSARQNLASLDEEFETGNGTQQTLLETLADDLATDRQTLSSDIALHVDQALDWLSPRQKMVFLLRHYHGYKLREIARILKCNEGTVKKYLFVATGKMREQLKGFYQ